MIDQYELPVYIAGKLPQLKNELVCRNEKDLYHTIQVLTDYTKKMVIEHDFKMVEKCMHLAERIYMRGIALVKNAIENVFIFSFSSLWALCNIVEWRIIQSYMPSGLYTLYMRQVLRTGD